MLPDRFDDGPYPNASRPDNVDKMDAIVDQLARQVTSAYQALPNDTHSRLLIGIAGIPGSGKSTVAYPLADRINVLLGGKSRPPQTDSTLSLASENPNPGGISVIARCVGLDGWHFSRAHLDSMPDPETAHFRRGAPFTYDSENYTHFVRLLRSDFTLPIPFPTFEHAKKDPVPTPHPVLPQHRIIIVEGLYTLLDVEEWREAAQEMDMRVFVSVDRAVARERCIKRNFAAGLSTSEEATAHRVDVSDMVNGDLVVERLLNPVVIVNCLQDADFALSSSRAADQVPN